MPVSSSPPHLSLKDGIVYANSKDVADYFDRRHSNVMQAIRDVKAALTAEKSAVWFQEAVFAQKTGFAPDETTQKGIEDVQRRASAQRLTHS